MIRYNKWRSIALFTIFITAIFSCVNNKNLHAQTSDVLSSSPIFQNDETFQYKLVFKWGLIRGKVGEATLTNKRINSGQQYFTQVHLKSVGIGDAFFRVRDTLETLYSSNHLPLRFEKRADENDYKMIDEISFKHSTNTVRASVKGYRNGEIRVDTVYTYNRGKYEVIDMLSSIALVRGFDLSNPKSINGKKILIPIGNSQAFTQCIYHGLEEMRMPDGTRVEAVIIRLDVQDEAFKTQQNSVMVWVTNDELRIPLKVSANLKIGKVLVDLVSYHNKNR